MTLKECYVCMEADYDGVIKRLVKEERVKKYLARLPEEPCFAELEAAFDGQKPEEAFQSAHTMKGICMNLGLNKLADTVCVLTDELRGGQITERAISEMEKLREDYLKAIQYIRKLD